MRLSLRARGVRPQRKITLDRMVEAHSVSSSTSAPQNRSTQVMASLGLQYNRPFHRDSAFLLLLALGPMAWLSIIGVFTFQPLPRHVIWSPAFLSIALWQPMFEELFFRGIVQGHLLQSMARQKAWFSLSTSNLLTSVLFSSAHLPSHSISWSLLVFVPSLCFGFARDRFGSVYPSIALHVFYNTGYFLLIGGVDFLNSR